MVLGLASVALPAAAGAQAYSCAVPAVLPPIHPELPNERNPQRLLPIGGYTLAVTWTPEYCFSHKREPSAAFECGGEGGGGARFGFSLHGLWPDGIGPEWPQYCKSTPLLPDATLRRNLCATPSAQLLQHEWAKHGTCTGSTPDAYFARSTGLYGKLVWPDMTAFGRGTTTVGAVAQAIAAANPGVSADMMRVTATRDGWLDEVWFCLDKQMAYTRCKAGSGGAAPATTIRVARPRDPASAQAGRSYGSSYRARPYSSARY
ncbi:ribonuclease T [uncultured Sphingomonas sp.]|uniref:ribonuclease T2 family protein n=1 Tax=uncultured Sphingomonas sp. TaxID=158754 RepID=UPI0035CAA39D